MSRHDLAQIELRSLMLRRIFLGDFGRGAISCRMGQHFTGHGSAPALFALEGANIGFQFGRRGYRFCPVGHESQRGELNPEQQNKAWW